MTRSVLLLAGGLSRRLGRDKTWMPLGGPPLIARALAAARGADFGADPDILVSVRDVERFETEAASLLPDALIGTRVIGDEFEARGPVAGLAAGLAAASGVTVAVLAVDMPSVTSRLIDGLLDELDGSPEADAIIPVVDGRDQLLCAAYRSRVASAAAELLGNEDAGPAGPSVGRLVAGLDARRVAQVAGYGAAELRVLTRGINTPEDLEWFVKHLGE